MLHFVYASEVLAIVNYGMLTRISFFNNRKKSFWFLFLPSFLFYPNLGWTALPLWSAIDRFYWTWFGNFLDDEKYMWFFFSSFIPVQLVSAEIGNGNNKTLLENLVSVDTHPCQKPRGSGNITSKLVPTRLPDWLPDQRCSQKFSLKRLLKS